MRDDQRSCSRVGEGVGFLCLAIVFVWVLIGLMLSLLTGCVGTRLVDKSPDRTVSATYLRMGGQDIQNFHAEQGDFNVGWDSAGAPEPEILKPGQWSEIVSDYLGAGLAKSAIQSIAEDAIKSEDFSVSAIKEKLSAALEKQKEQELEEEEPAGDPENWRDQYHIYTENNGAPVEKGLWKPDSDSSPGRPVMLLPAHMARTGVASVIVDGKDETDSVRKYPTDLKPILANGLRLHYNPQAVGQKALVLVELNDGTQWISEVVNGSQRQDPLTFVEVVNDDGGNSGDDTGSIGGSDDGGISGDGDLGGDPGESGGQDAEGGVGEGVGEVHASNPRYSPGLVEIPAEFLTHGAFVELRYEKCSLANGYLSPVDGSKTMFRIPGPEHDVWRWTDEQNRTPPRCIGTVAKFSDGAQYDGYVGDYKGEYPMPVGKHPGAFWVRMK